MVVLIRQGYVSVRRKDPKHGSKTLTMRRFPTVNAALAYSKHIAVHPNRMYWLTAGQGHRERLFMVSPVIHTRPERDRKIAELDWLEERSDL